MRTTSRIWQLDFLRGLAVVGMVVYHAAFLLVYIWGWNIPVITGPWRMLARSSAILFLILVGCSLWLKAQRIDQSLSWFDRWRLFWPRAERIALAAAAITLFTIKFTNDPVLFGILHHIATSSLILSLLIILIPQKRWWWLALTIIFWGGGELLSGYHTSFPWLLWLGLSPISFHSLDYFPLLPWMGWSTAGVWLIRTIQALPLWQTLVKQPQPKITTAFTDIGQKALLIYLIHLPLLFFVFWLVHAALVFVRLQVQ